MTAPKARRVEPATLAAATKPYQGRNGSYPSAWSGVVLRSLAWRVLLVLLGVVLAVALVTVRLGLP